MLTKNQKIEPKTNNNKFIIDLLDTKDNKDFIQFLKDKNFNIDLIDKINNYFVTFKLNEDEVPVPFNYILINTNKKLNGIPYIDFELFCSSKILGYCNIPNSCCYSIRDQNRFKNNYYKIKLNVNFFELVQISSKLFNKVIEYLKQFKLIRFNCNNDLKDKKSIKLLKNMALSLPDSIITGYTNRIDLISNTEDLKELELPSNLIFNGSGYMLNNNYTTTTNLKLFINSNYKCLGSCKNCLKCFNNKNKIIYCLLHGSLNTIDKYFNTADNRQYLIKFFNNNFNYLNLKDEDLKVNKGLLSSLNKYLKQHKIYNTWKFKNYPELINYICIMNGII